MKNLQEYQLSLSHDLEELRVRLQSVERERKSFEKQNGVLQNQVDSLEGSLLRQCQSFQEMEKNLQAKIDHYKKIQDNAASVPKHKCPQLPSENRQIKLLKAKSKQDASYCIHQAHFPFFRIDSIN